MNISDIVNLADHPITDQTFIEKCKETLDKTGALVLDQFLTNDAVEYIRKEGSDNKHLAFYCHEEHNVYLMTPDTSYPEGHAMRTSVTSSKGCIQDDQIPDGSPLHTLYDDHDFRKFLATVLGEEALYDYADSLSSINLHYADEGQELGWHFDNSSFATTLLIQQPNGGGEFEYVENMRDADKGEMNYDGVKEVLDGNTPVKHLKADEGTLVLFRGRNAIHRVTPTIGDKTRMLVVLAYNSEPGIAISEKASMTFYGRVGEITTPA
ncbi:2OG-Fe(II) oxygenase [Pseudemcibacter aquimaris]|uniref:HalD/BesD family halogenase n=1 Tax=Pseudemcibacter aquimaris TaxID=2857064 RepID=UPI002012616D|nr:2OG-Fe(II) oxygenase [Pseudemcibacter aquimaris]MCC3861574.1 2OG-Fe(II) oxygenase [Pseudemcibacter aquimaris]WDU58343.1 2OG-Fe(II) oxygenase [Pseudemcibacter aquimaris]